MKKKPHITTEEFLAAQTILAKEMGLGGIYKELEADPESREIVMAKTHIRKSFLDTGGPQLDHLIMVSIIASALAKNDAAFFKSLGRELERLEADPPCWRRAFDPLSLLLISNWSAWRRTEANLPGLNRLSEDSLAVFCGVILKQELSEDAVKKARQRLGLKPARGKKIHLIYITGELKQV